MQYLILNFCVPVKVFKLLANLINYHCMQKMHICYKDLSLYKNVITVLIKYIDTYCVKKNMYISDMCKIVALSVCVKQKLEQFNL